MPVPYQSVRVLVRHGYFKRETTLLAMSHESNLLNEQNHRLEGHWMTALAKIHAQSAAKMLIALVCLPVLLLWWTADASSQKAIDTERSVLTVRVYKTGLLSALGHEHEIRAPIQKGTFDEGKNTVEFVVDAR